VLEARLARDALWDAQVVRQANEIGMGLLEVDGIHSVDELVDDLAGCFRLDTCRAQDSPCRGLTIIDG
jgi:hypothetical protein